MFNIPDAKIAFFDLDKTIVDRDTDELWGLWRIRRGPRGLIEFFWLLYLAMHFKEGRLNIEKYMRYQKFRLLSAGIDGIKKLSAVFFEKKGKRYIRPGIVAIIDHYRDRQCRVVIITNQNEFLARPFADHLGVDLVANSFTVINGKFHEPLEPYVFEEGKAARAREYAEKYGLTLDDCAFYGDSISDMPLLEKTGSPVVVTPDEYLLKIALEKGWPVINFDDKHGEEL